MKEEFVHAVWKYQLFNKKNLTTVDGHVIEIVHPGFSHINAGPDFLSAKIIIDGILWAGNVEIHVHSYEWNQHKHQHDPVYNNVILHVVFEDDGRVYHTQNGIPLNTFIIKPHIERNTLLAYQNLAEDMRVLPCVAWWNKLDKTIVENWLIRLCIERLMQKCGVLKARLQLMNEHWDQLFFEMVARQLGFHVNAEPMERLARSIKIEWVQKLCDQPLSIEALFFGQAGMLHRSFEEEYPKALQKEYRYLQQKYQLEPMDVSNWKFSRLRPSNFPSIRIAQLASIFRTKPRFFSEVLLIEDFTQVENFFQVTLPSYWDTHYRFDKESVWQLKHLGEDSLQQLMLNTVCLVWLLYGDVKDEEAYKIRCLQLMERMNAEKNRYTEKFQECQYELGSSIQSQGIRFLWENYCDNKKCLTCSIGIHGLKYS